MPDNITIFSKQIALYGVFINIGTVAGLIVFLILAYKKSKSIERVFVAFMAGFAYLSLKNEDSIERLQYVTDRCGVTIDQTAINTIMTYENTYDIDEMPGFKTDMHAPAYYMFTSGTTGRPKAVAIYHKSLDIRIRWHEKTFRDGIEVGMHKTNTLFDVSMW